MYMQTGLMHAIQLRKILMLPLQSPNLTPPHQRLLRAELAFFLENNSQRKIESLLRMTKEMVKRHMPTTMTIEHKMHEQDMTRMRHTDHDLKQVVQRGPQPTIDSCRMDHATAHSRVAPSTKVHDRSDSCIGQIVMRNIHVTGACACHD